MDEECAADYWRREVRELRTQLAACQARNVELREALKWQVLATCHAAHGDASQVTEYQVVLAKEALSRTTDTEALDAAIAKAVTEVRTKYDELVYAVAIKHPKESRHETALRYIRQAETPSENRSGKASTNTSKG